VTPLRAANGLIQVYRSGHVTFSLGCYAGSSPDGPPP
jgi:hypothetical protein